MLVLNKDFETRGVLDLTDVGAHKYLWHPATEITLCSYALRDHTEEYNPSNVRLWERIFCEPLPRDLLDAWLDPNVVIEAWNAQFERLATIEYAQRLFEQDPSPVHRELLKSVSVYERWRCTAARARACALPGKLDLCARFLNTPIKKDRIGSQLIRELCMPRADGTWDEDRQKYTRFGAYCVDDNRAEGLIGSVIRQLTETEQQDYVVNEKLNDRGIPVDIELAKAALHYADDEAADIRKELSRLTCGRVTDPKCTHGSCGAIRTPKQYQKLKDWVLPRVNDVVKELLTVEKVDKKTGQAVTGYTLDKAARASILDDPDISVGVSDEVLAVLELVDDAGRSSTAKFQSLINREIEGRIYGCYVLNGGGQTGRFSAHGFQPHNLPIREKISNVEDVIELIMQRAPVRDVMLKSGKNILTTLSCIIRPCVIAEEGKTLVWADYSAVEARVLPWLANDPAADDLLRMFFNNEDVYLKTASDIYGIPLEVLTAAYKAGDKVAYEQRQVGKVAVLALGFGGGAGAFKKMARAYGIVVDEKLAEWIKQAWRRANPWAQRFWDRLHNAACNAVQSPGVVYEAGRVAYMMQDTVLWCLLPDGRLINYPEARMTTREGRWGPERILTAAKGSWTPAQDQTHWPRHTLWHGILAENVTQGTAASLLRASLRDLDEADWPVVMDTHDEDLMEVGLDEVDDAKEALREAMLADRGWNKGLPLNVELSSAVAYGKS